MSYAQQWALWGTQPKCRPARVVANLAAGGLVALLGQRCGIEFSRASPVQQRRSARSAILRTIAPAKGRGPFWPLIADISAQFKSIQKLKD
jgi:hypothetical protein